MQEPADPTQIKKLEFVTLVAGGQNFCIEITQIREIRRWSPVTILPHSASHVLGVINLRGAVIPIIDLAAKLGFEKIEPTERHVIIITAIDERIVGLLVESVSEILGVNSDMVRETPRGPEDATTRAILGVIPVGDDMTKVINLTTLMPNSSQAAA
ncbi:chemotaxis protein CheW [Yoonia sediminilitoris]|uniref:Purine-binding chemotaxis protein CheW n=1 Tax=Yoonia sediminilitoris TaxID=1286148 RepID=A0A2T6KQA4_9RHOB|nr:chemotaxis protein CheW [Yoonia sediminilitoris]PUB18736.1 purine-binding chemotaxis protein CheW [Yoonia sediminilitoris]RCW98904.1 purine-binding chemotaxis protein CheW [Yoonia sediminilitoris]